MTWVVLQLMKCLTEYSILEAVNRRLFLCDSSAMVALVARKRAFGFVVWPWDNYLKQRQPQPGILSGLSLFPLATVLLPMSFKEIQAVHPWFGIGHVNSLILYFVFFLIHSPWVLFLSRCPSNILFLSLVYLHYFSFSLFSSFSSNCVCVCWPSLAPWLIMEL